MKIARVYVYLEANVYRWSFKRDYHSYKFKYYVSQSVSASYLISLIQKTEIEFVPIPNS